MKKFILTLGLALFAASMLQAAQVSENAARNIAAQFMQARGLGAIAPTAPMKAPRQGDAAPQSSAAYYVFNAQAGHGFVVVSGDDRTQQVLGYSDNGHFDPNNVPENLQDMLDQYATEIAMLDNGLIEAGNEAAIPTKASDAVQPLVKSMWGQRAPFYFQCPQVESNYCITGCTATAMAQIMHYHKWPQSTTKAIPAYTTKTRKIYMPQLGTTTFNWSAIKDFYSSTETDPTSAANAAVAKLMLYCGQAVVMDYGLNASASYGSGEVFVDYFGYSTKARQIYRCDYPYAEWLDYILSEIKAHRPVMCSSSNKLTGHAFVCDGYDGNGYFHFNWGGNGSFDGYFLFSALYPEGGSLQGIQESNGYTMVQRVIIGLEPNTVSTNEHNSVAECYGVSTAQATYTRSSSSDPFVITVNASYYNHTSVSRTYDLGWGVYASDGYTRKQNYSALDDNHTIGPEGYTAMTKTISFGKGYADGTYYLRPNSRESGSYTWYPCHYSGRNYLKAVISGNTLTLSASTNGDINGVTANIMGYSPIRKVNRPIEVALNVRNYSYNEDIPFYLWVDSQLMGANTLQLPSGSTGTVSILFTPTASTSTTREIKVTADTKGNNVYCTGQVTVSNDNLATDLSISYNVPNANSSYQVAGNKLTFVGYFMNNLSTTYNDYVRLKLYKRNPEGKYIAHHQALKPISISGSATASKYFDFDQLEPGKYFAVFFYYSVNSQITSTKTVVYELLGDGLKGDVNGDGRVNVSDVTELINMILGVTTMNKARADVNGDGQVNVSDVTALINIILGVG